MTENSTLTAAATLDSSFVHGPDSPQFDALRQRLPTIVGVEFDPVALAMPTVTAELSAAVQMAKRDNLGVLRLYSSSNFGAVMRGEGPTLVINLSGMNRVLEVDGRSEYARIEPGVTFAQLASHLAEIRSPLNVDSEADPDASVLASIFSKGIGHTPYSDHALMQCGAEFVLPDGSIVRTGMGAMEGNPTWQLYKYGFGPYSDGLAVQSSTMIASQAGIWLMGAVPFIEGLVADLDGPSSVASAIDAIRPFKHANLLAGTVRISHSSLDAFKTGSEERSNNWRLASALYGMPKTVEISKNIVIGALGSLGGVRLRNPAELADDQSWLSQMEVMSGKVATQAPNGTSAVLTFAGLLEGEVAEKVIEITERHSTEEIPILLEFIVPARALLTSLHIPYSKAEEISGKAEFVRTLVEAMADAGLGLVSESYEFQKVATDALVDSPLRQMQTSIDLALS